MQNVLIAYRRPHSARAERNLTSCSWQLFKTMEHANQNQPKVSRIMPRGPPFFVFPLGRLEYLWQCCDATTLRWAVQRAAPLRVMTPCPRGPQCSVLLQMPESACLTMSVSSGSHPLPTASARGPPARLPSAFQRNCKRRRRGPPQSAPNDSPKSQPSERRERAKSFAGGRRTDETKDNIAE